MSTGFLGDIFSDAQVLTENGTLENINPEQDAGAPRTGVAPEGGSGLYCSVCEAPLTYRGRGRKPTKCDDCKRGRPANGGDSAPPTRAPRKPVSARAQRRQEEFDSRLQAVADDLMEGLGLTAGGLGVFAPVTAGTIMVTGPDAVNGLVGLAARYPKMLDGLEKAAAAMPFLYIGKLAAALVLALGVDMGKAVPQGMVAEYLGVATAAREVGWQPPSRPTHNPEPNTADGFIVPAPPQFSLNL